MAHITGNYVLENSSDNFANLMRGTGRQANMCGELHEKITEQNGIYTIRTSSAFRTTEIIFKLGEQFGEVDARGRVVMSTITLDGNTLTQHQIGTKDNDLKDTTIIRKFDDAGMSKYRL